MAPNGQRQDTRNWYKISIDAVRAWTTILAVLAIGIGGFWGYTLLSKHFLEREVTVAIENSEKLLERLATERELDAHRQRVETATGHLDECENPLSLNGDLLAARDEAERCLALLSSVDDALRHRSPAGEAQIIATKGKVEVRRGERGEWRAGKKSNGALCRGLRQDLWRTGQPKA